MVAFKDYEIGWLRAFLASASATGYDVHGRAGRTLRAHRWPIGASFDKNLATVWNPGGGGDAAPSYDSAEQQQYVLALLKRH